MGWLTKTVKKPVLTRTEALNCMPVKNQHVSEVRLESGEILLHYPVAVKPWVMFLGKWLRAGTAQTRSGKLQLDILGSAVWDLLDGKRSLQRVATVFAVEHQLEPEEAEVAVTQFIRELGRRGLIGLR